MFSVSLILHFLDIALAFLVLGSYIMAIVVLGLYICTRIDAWAVRCNEDIKIGKYQRFHLTFGK
jgi:hypothetical protein